MVTVVHQRAFAGVKKATVASACASLRGVPDLKRVTQKKALEASAFGTPKGLICRPKSGPDPNAIGDCTKTKTANFFDINGVKPLYVSQNQLAKGCGTLTSTVDKSYNFRLYEKGWCPVKYDATGLFYETTAKYYTKKDGILTANSCELPPP